MIELRVTRDVLTAGLKLAPNEQYTIVLVSAVQRIRLIGMFFDLNKCFLLPSAMGGIRAIKRQYDAHPKANILVVGHTDTSGKDDYNLTLSLERADAVAAYLTDAKAAWVAFFSDKKAQEKRWGALEVQHMLTVLPAGGAPCYTDKPNGSEDAKHKAAVKRFQQSKGLEPDGIAGPLTQDALVQAYMALDGTTLPAGTTLTTHGCGENFPEDATGDGVRDADNRRVELFFFDGPITPAPPGKTSARGSAEYPKWRQQVQETIDFSASAVITDTGALIGLQPPFFDAIPAEASVTFTPSSGATQEFALSAGVDLGDGLLHFAIADPQPGVLYTATVRLAKDAPSVVLFEGIDLSLLVAERQGNASASPPPLGHDGLVFATEPETVSDDVQAGGPGETTPEQLASVSLPAGGTAVV